MLRKWFWPAFFGLVVLSGCLGTFWVAWKFLQSPAQGPHYTEKRFVDNGTDTHNLVVAEGLRIPDSEPVIGVIVDGSPRAYVLDAFFGQANRHLLNDKSGSSPVVVTFCDRTQCIRIFGGADQPLPTIQVGGWRADQTMELLIDGVGHSHKSESLGLPELQFERTTWGAWKTAHPDTRVYTGRS